MNDKTMGNQQENVTSEELAWLTGIIEGEGSISMNARHKKWKDWQGFGVDIQIAIVNTDGGIIEKCHTIFLKMGVEGRVCEPRMRQPTKLHKLNDTVVVQGKQQLVITVCKITQVKKILDSILPYFGGEKKSRARLMLDYVNRRLRRQEENGKKFVHFDDGDVENIKRFYAVTGRNFESEKYGLSSTTIPNGSTSK